MQRLAAFAVAVLPALALAACEKTHAPAAHEPVAGATRAAVHVIVDLPRDAFAADSDISVTVWNEQQLALQDALSHCMVQWDGHQATTICDDNITHPEPHPETFTFKASDLAHPLAFDATSIARGQRYEISFGGRASDGCNSTGGSARGTVSSTEIRIAQASLATTDMACARTGG